MPDFVLQLAGLAVLIVPLLAIQWNLAAELAAARGWPLVGSSSVGASSCTPTPLVRNGPSSIASDIPFPVKQVRSARGGVGPIRPVAGLGPTPAGVEVVVDDPFTDDVLSGLFGVEHQVRFVTGNEAVDRCQRRSSGPGQSAALRAGIRGMNPRPARWLHWFVVGVVRRWPRNGSLWLWSGAPMSAAGSPLPAIRSRLGDGR